MTTVTAPTTNAAVVSVAADAPDPRRITEHDPALARLKRRTVRQLTLSVRAFMRDLRAGSGMQQGEAQSAFINRQVAILRGAYLAAHREGQRDYYGPVSRVPGKWASGEPDSTTLARRMAFYLPSVAKMAHEAAMAANTARMSNLSARPAKASDLAVSAPQRHVEHTEHIRLAGEPDALDEWQQSVGARISLQADLTWSGGQDGYTQAGWSDTANPYQFLWWDLEPIAQHCSDCPALAAGSPYTAPGTGASGGNELNQTPGDGQTECGAGCRCGLRYGDAGSMAPTADWKTWAPVGSPGLPDGPMTPTLPPPVGDGTQGAAAAVNAQPENAPETQFRTIPAIPGGEFNAGQKRALDLYRLAELNWNAVRGTLPELPNFFTLANPNFESPRYPPFDTLTRAQQQALTTAFEAFAVWMANVPSEWLAYLEDDF